MKTAEEMQELYDKHEYLIQTTIRKQGFGGTEFLELHGLTMDDIFQHGRLGLHRACKEYNPTKKTSFRTFAISNIIWTISTESKKESLSRDSSWTFDTINKVSFDSVAPDKTGETVTLHDMVADDNLHEINDNAELEDYLEKLRSNLPERLVKIINLKIKGISNDKIGETLGCTHQNVSYLLRKNKKLIKSLIS